MSKSRKTKRKTNAPVAKSKTKSKKLTKAKLVAKPTKSLPVKNKIVTKKYRSELLLPFANIISFCKSKIIQPHKYTKTFDIIIVAVVEKIISQIYDILDGMDNKSKIKPKHLKDAFAIHSSFFRNNLPIYEEFNYCVQKEDKINKAEREKDEMNKNINKMKKPNSFDSVIKQIYMSKYFTNSMISQKTIKDTTILTDPEEKRISFDNVLDTSISKIIKQHFTNMHSNTVMFNKVISEVKNDLLSINDQTVDDENDSTISEMNNKKEQIDKIDTEYFYGVIYSDKKLKTIRNQIIKKIKIELNAEITKDSTNDKIFISEDKYRSVRNKYKPDEKTDKKPLKFCKQTYILFNNVLEIFLVKLMDNLNNIKQSEDKITINANNMRGAINLIFSDHKDEYILSDVHDFVIITINKFNDSYD